MVRVMTSGVFDILHPGHLFYLEEAKALGDELYVVVATDLTARERKHEPINLEDMRLRMVQALKPVDNAMLGYEGDMYKVVLEIKPDIIAIGHDQKHEPEKIEADLAERGLDVKVVRLERIDHDLNGTRKIIRKVIDWHIFQKRMEEVEKGGKRGDDI